MDIQQTIAEVLKIVVALNLSLFRDIDDQEDNSFIVMAPWLHQFETGPAMLIGNTWGDILDELRLSPKLNVLSEQVYKEEYGDETHLNAFDYAKQAGWQILWANNDF
jgi:hypothetical protein